MPPKPNFLHRARTLADQLLGRGITHVVPLGLSCRVTHQARTCFGVGVAYPFDWWISPMVGLTRYLGVLDPDRIYRPEALEERIVDSRVESIRSVEFGVELHHEFPRCREAGVSFVRSDWREQIAEARAQHTRRLDRLLDLDRRGNRILFLRHKYSVEPLEPARALEIDDLWQVLTSRWSHARVDLLLVNVVVDGALPPSVRSITFDDPPAPPPEEWRGETARWRTAFYSCGVRIDSRVARAAAFSPPASTSPPN